MTREVGYAPSNIIRQAFAAHISAQPVMIVHEADVHDSLSASLREPCNTSLLQLGTQSDDACTNVVAAFL
jgi:hypothetical protein